MVTKRRSYQSGLAIHPGEVLAEELEARGMTQRALAEAIGRPDQVISEIVHGKKGITAETALQLAEAFGVSAEFWMNLQMGYELTVARSSARARRGRRPVVETKAALRQPGRGRRVAAR